MSTADKLNALVLTKADIKLALIDKGLNPTDVFSTYADDIRAIETGGSSGGVFDFASIGYTGNEEPLKSGIEYAKQILDIWEKDNAYTLSDPNLVIFPNLKNFIATNYKFLNCYKLLLIPKILLGSSLINTFANCYSLPLIPLLDYSNVENMEGMFSTCKSLTNVGYIDCSSCTNLARVFNECEMLDYNPLINIVKPISDFTRAFKETSISEISLNNCDLNNLNQTFYECMQLTKCDLSGSVIRGSMSDVFYGCSKLNEYLAPDVSNVTSLKDAFNGCLKLKELPELNSVNCTNMSNIFNGCSDLVKVNSISVKSETNHTNTYHYLFGYIKKSHNYFLIKDLGTPEVDKGWNFTYVYNWGIEDESEPLTLGARQSLVDTLITYSFDRASAGYNSITITLDANTKALLTEDEIAQITAKGFTIA